MPIYKTSDSGIMGLFRLRNTTFIALYIFLFRGHVENYHELVQGIVCRYGVGMAFEVSLKIFPL